LCPRLSLVLSFFFSHTHPHPKQQIMPLLADGSLDTSTTFQDTGDCCLWKVFRSCGECPPLCLLPTSLRELLCIIHPGEGEATCPVLQQQQDYNQALGCSSRDNGVRGRLQRAAGRGGGALCGLARGVHSPRRTSLLRVVAPRAVNPWAGGNAMVKSVVLSFRVLPLRRAHHAAPVSVQRLLFERGDGSENWFGVSISTCEGGKEKQAIRASLEGDPVEDLSEDLWAVIGLLVSPPSWVAGGSQAVTFPLLFSCWCRAQAGF